MTSLDGSSLWLGPVHTEARAGYHRARAAGLSPLRALVIGTVASFKECWTFRRNLALQVGCSVRTVQRALTEARAEGLIGLARAKKDEVPPGWHHGPITCGWSHRWVIGWGQAGERAQAAVQAARARWLVKHAAPNKMTTPPRPAEPARPGAPPRPTARPEYQRRSWTAAELDAELDAELERLARPPF